MIKWELLQECKVDTTFANLINVIHPINKMKDMSHVIILTDAEKAFDEIQHLFVIKDSGKWE